MIRLLADGIPGKKLSEGDSPDLYVILQDGLTKYAKDWRQVIAEVSDSTGKTWTSKEDHETQDSVLGSHGPDVNMSNCGIQPPALRAADDTDVRRRGQSMTVKEWTDLIAVVFSAGSLVIAIFALRRVRSAERGSLAAVKTQVFLTFRERFQQIKHDLPPRWSDKDWLPQPNTDEWRRIELYWQNAFDEWFVPTRLNKEHLEDVWRLFFEAAVKSALYSRPLRYVGWRLCEEGEFGQYHTRDFAAVLEQLWGRPLKDSDF